MTDRISARKEYQQLITLFQDTLAEVAKIEPEARVLLILDSRPDISICSPTANMDIVDILGLLSVVQLRYQIMESSVFQQKIAVQEAMDNPAIQLVPKNDKPN